MGRHDAESWREDPERRGADFRIVNPRGEGRGINFGELLESLDDLHPLPPPLCWSVSMSRTTADVARVRSAEDFDFVPVLTYKFILQGMPEGERPTLYFWCLDKICDTGRSYPCEHEWWRNPNEFLESKRIVTLKCAKCMVEDYVSPDVTHTIEVHGVMPREWSTSPGSYTGKKGGPMRPLPVWPPRR